MNTRESDFWNERSGPRIAPEYLGNIVATAADLALVLSEGGTVISVTTNPLNSALGQIGHWEGRNITDFLAPDSVAKVTGLLTAVAANAAGRPDAIEVNHIDGGAWDFPVRYTMHLTGRDGRILMLGRDMRPVAELQQRLVRAQLALEKDYEGQRVFETRYRVLLEASNEALVLVDVGTGRILDANSAAAKLFHAGQAALSNSAFTQEFEGRKRADFLDSLIRAAEDESGQAVVAPLRRNGQEVAIRPSAFRNAGERVLLCRIHRTESGPTTSVKQDLSDRLAALYTNGSDAIVFTDDDYRIVQANDAFLTMMDVDSIAPLRGLSFPDTLARGSVDLKVITDTSQIGAYATRLITRFGSSVSVEIVCVALPDGQGQGFVLRDMGRGTMLRDTGVDADMPGDAGLGNATALVGSAPLRDIVASMTDVVEKQCIEAAVELTNNNRVAAAEMLGLSRQSLYVKLRKYGLLQRDES
ncbi:transcriptional regulator PpsR [Jannaschia pagri]|uniref:Transcriptional regulator PpsR n=1 Tax=Jannaschia pagri TaxID=2829797 RepID=A0ABQ4NLX9_9RHOB|nr:MULTISPECIES: transcriptional regulator PpsR [unclassified Jannaschia]GIT91385.1 transcriptional regulator PpsR [Jannaschia sp. AI_61]GIT95219.1 transcriptional regulator PpsR [Jannaschia sp. AI_62]